MASRIDSTSKEGFHGALPALSQSFVAIPVTFLSFPVSNPKGLGKTVTQILEAMVQFSARSSTLKNLLLASCMLSKSY